ncbi:MAG: hypothetical protein K2G93_06065 [Rikenella sp.]|nr:hypothetical protein [Rikenella sp.]
MYHVGNGGYSWSSTIRDLGVYHLTINSDRIDPQGGGRLRAYGLQLRCLQE